MPLPGAVTLRPPVIDEKLNSLIRWFWLKAWVTEDSRSIVGRRLVDDDDLELDVLLA